MFTGSTRSIAINATAAKLPRLPEELCGMALRDRLMRLLEILSDAEASGDQTRRAATLAELQRVIAWALRDAVAQAREQGASWRELAADLRMATPTLYSQFRAGRGVVATGQS